MRKENLKYLGCCYCGSELKIEKGKMWRQEMRTGELRCTGCGLVFPVAAGRPVIMTSEAVREWKSPVSEAMGETGYATFDQSVEKLVQIGIEESLRMVRNREVSGSEMPRPMSEIPGSVVAKMKYRSSGKWFRSGRRMERLMTFPWAGGDSENSFNAFMKAVADTKPGFLLDVASGGGFGVSHQAWYNSSVKRIIAVERDLKCLGNIQYRFSYVGKAGISEAAGGDVRHLPVQSETVDTAMMFAALPEIWGITRVISEVYRVLKNGGYWVLMITEKPFQSEAVSPEDFVRFARGADLYSGYQQFLSDAEAGGFSIDVSTGFVNESGTRRRLISLRK